MDLNLLYKLDWTLRNFDTFNENFIKKKNLAKKFVFQGGAFWGVNMGSYPFFPPRKHKWNQSFFNG